MVEYIIEITLKFLVVIITGFQWKNYEGIEK